MPVESVDDPAIDAAFAAWERDALLLAGAATSETVREAWFAAFAEVASSRPGAFDPEAALFMRKYHFAAIRKLTAEQRETVRLVLLDAVKDGVGVDEAARRLGERFDARRSRLRVIARTELNRGANWGRLQGYVASGVVEEVEWVATHDDRVRPDHLASDGNRTRPGQPFPGPGASRGVVSAPAGINCRCTIAPVTRLTRLLEARKDLRAQAFHDIFPGLAERNAAYEEALDEAWTRLHERITREGIRGTNQ